MALRQRARAQRKNHPRSCPDLGPRRTHPDGTYYIEWYEIGNQRRRKAVHDFADLLDAARRKALEVEAVRAAHSRRVLNERTRLIFSDPPHLSWLTANGKLRV